MSDTPENLLHSQIEYYRARAGEYDDWFYRRGRYDRGPEHTAAWFRDVKEVHPDLYLVIHDPKDERVLHSTRRELRRNAGVEERYAIEIPAPA